MRPNALQRTERLRRWSPSTEQCGPTLSGTTGLAPGRLAGRRRRMPSLNPSALCCRVQEPCRTHAHRRAEGARRGHGALGRRSAAEHSRRCTCARPRHRCRAIVDSARPPRYFYGVAASAPLQGRRPWTYATLRPPPALQRSFGSRPHDGRAHAAGPLRHRPDWRATIRAHGPCRPTARAASCGFVCSLTRVVFMSNARRSPGAARTACSPCTSAMRASSSDGAMATRRDLHTRCCTSRSSATGKRCGN